MKTILNISDVFNAINSKKENCIGYKSSVFIGDTEVEISKNLLRLARKGISQMHCCICGCTGTHLQAHYEQYSKDQYKKVWRVMVWNSKYQKQSFLNLDHIICASRGGTWDNKNLRVTCFECNNERGNTYIAEEQVGGIIQTEEFVKIKDTLNLINKHSQLKTGQFDLIKSKINQRLKSYNANMSFKRVPIEVMKKVVKKTMTGLNINLNSNFYGSLQTVAFS